VKAGNRSTTGGGDGWPMAAAFAVVGVCCGMPLTMLLSAPAVAARIVVSGAPALQPHLQGWLLAALCSPLLAVGLVRLVLTRRGRLLSRATSPAKRWRGMLARAGALLGAVNVMTFLHLMRIDSTEHTISAGMSVFCTETLAGLAVLAAVAVWDRRPEPVTVEQVRAAAAQADHTLRRIRAENERVRLQAERVQMRLAKLRAQAGTADHVNGGARGPQRSGRSERPERPGRSERPERPGRPGRRHDQSAVRSDVDFIALRHFHRESFQCADTAHMAFRSTQESLHVMSSMVRRARLMPQHWLSVGRAAKLARAEMRAAAVHLDHCHGELRMQVMHGLDTVRTLNANTSELKHEIRDSCGAPGRDWFEALEQRIEEVRDERRAGRL
jgi:hypothetical protein